MKSLWKRFADVWYLRRRGWHPLPGGRWAYKQPDDVQPVIVNTMSDAVHAQERVDATAWTFKVRHSDGVHSVIALSAVRFSSANSALRDVIEQLEKFGPHWQIKSMCRGRVRIRKAFLRDAIYQLRSEPRKALYQ